MCEYGIMDRSKMGEGPNPSPRAPENTSKPSAHQKAHFKVNFNGLGDDKMDVVNNCLF